MVVVYIASCSLGGAQKVVLAPKDQFNVRHAFGKPLVEQQYGPYGMVELATQLVTSKKVNLPHEPLSVNPRKKSNYGTVTEGHFRGKFLVFLASKNFRLYYIIYIPTNISLFLNSY